MWWQNLYDSDMLHKSTSSKWLLSMVKNERSESWCWENQNSYSNLLPSFAYSPSDHPLSLQRCYYCCRGDGASACAWSLVCCRKRLEKETRSNYVYFARDHFQEALVYYQGNSKQRSQSIAISNYLSIASTFLNIWVRAFIKTANTIQWNLSTTDTAPLLPTNFVRCVVVSAFRDVRYLQFSL